MSVDDADLRSSTAGSVSSQNERAWQGDTYGAWVQRFGHPCAAAAKIKKDPRKKLYPLDRYFAEVSGKKIVNLMGSNGMKAVALALLGADVTVVDYAKGNCRYARELAAAAGVEIHYVLSDVLHIPPVELRRPYDLVFAELGITHYFVELKPLMDVVFKLLDTGGHFILRDFHPVSTKLISYRGTTAKVRKYKITGDYFDTSLEEKEVSYSKFLAGEEQGVEKVFWRKWTLGEIITAVASAGLFIQVLEEEPNLSSDVFDKGIPKTYTLVANKRGA